MDEQAAERDAERDEFLKEVEKLRMSLKEKENKDKDKSAIENFEKKVNCLKVFLVIPMSISFYGTKKN